MNTQFITSVNSPDKLPPADFPEIAFVGRSNCGKSSLLNAVANQRNLARKSRTPGRTQMLNFFRVEKPALMLVDLPGFGFSATSHDVRAHWQSLVEAYLERDNIKCVLFLFDCRRDLSDEDLDILRFLDRNHPTLFVLTKADKFSAAQLKKRTDVLEKQLKVFRGKRLTQEFVVTSTLKKTGIEELRKLLLKSGASRLDS